jgi:hypothetical protein
MTAPDLRSKGIEMQGAVTQVPVYLMEKGLVSAGLGILTLRQVSWLMLAAVFVLQELASCLRRSTQRHCNNRRGCLSHLSLALEIDRWRKTASVYTVAMGGI